MRGMESKVGAHAHKFKYAYRDRCFYTTADVKMLKAQKKTGLPGFLKLMLGKCTGGHIICPSRK